MSCWRSNDAGGRLLPPVNHHHVVKLDEYDPPKVEDAVRVLPWWPNLLRDDEPDERAGAALKADGR
jgi:hypothetical protein